MPPPRLGDEAHAGQAIPCVEVGFVVPDKPPRRDVSEHQRARAVADEAAAGLQKPADDRADLLGRHAQACADAGHPVLHRASGVDPQRLAVQRRAAMLRGDVEFVMAGREDDADDGRVVFQNRDRDAPVRHAVQKRRGAVDRVHGPDIGRAAFDEPVFFAQKAIVGKGRANGVANDLLDLPVGDRHHVLRVALAFDGQRVAVEVVEQRTRPSRAGDLDGAGEPQIDLIVGRNREPKAGDRWIGHETLRASRHCASAMRATPWFLNATVTSVCGSSAMCAPTSTT